MLFPAENVG